MTSSKKQKKQALEKVKKVIFTDTMYHEFKNWDSVKFVDKIYGGKFMYELTLTENQQIRRHRQYYFLDIVDVIDVIEENGLTLLAKLMIKFTLKGGVGYGQTDWTFCGCPVCESCDNCQTIRRNREANVKCDNWDWDTCTNHQSHANITVKEVECITRTEAYQPRNYTYQPPDYTEEQIREILNSLDDDYIAAPIGTHS